MPLLPSQKATTLGSGQSGLNFARRKLLELVGEELRALSRGVTVPVKRSRSPPPSVFLRTFPGLASLFDLHGKPETVMISFGRVVINRHLLAYFQFRTFRFRMKCPTYPSVPSRLQLPRGPCRDPVSRPSRSCGAIPSLPAKSALPSATLTTATKLHVNVFIVTNFRTRLKIVFKNFVPASLIGAADNRLSPSAPARPRFFQNADRRATDPKEAVI